MWVSILPKRPDKKSLLNIKGNLFSLNKFTTGELGRSARVGSGQGDGRSDDGASASVQLGRERTEKMSFAAFDGLDNASVNVLLAH